MRRFSMEGDNPDRFRFRTDEKEMERRWKVTREAMKKNEIDCLVLWGDNQIFGGVQKYLTDLQVPVYPHGFLFSQEGISIVGHGDWGGKACGDYQCCRQTLDNISVPFLPSICFTDTYPAEEFCKIIRRHKWKKVGFVAMNILPAGVYKYMTESLKDVTFTDATNMMDEIKAVKSPYELEQCARAVALHEDVLAAVPSILRVGRTEREVSLALRHLADDMYCSDFLVLTGAHPYTPGGNLYLYQNNRIQKGDYVYILVELAGPGGIWAELGRTYCMGEPSPAMEQAWRDAVRLENDLAAMCVPGANPGDIFLEGNRRLAAAGYVEEGHFYAHGQGYDIVDRPIFCPEETMVLKENMYFSMHPRCKNKDAAAICIDNFTVTKQGGKRISQIPQNLISIDY
ncbi:M24 family metallopeptidase [Lachnoclostridium edouardi]|uniref:M24 family metallopeptidase n=1 Tax=Lachnoclostridium edouardi TaxID=1926283 RepID=UPI0011AFD0FF|nr:M24 family metallopeptidase [Lachnoclostridium edouardi]